METPFPLRFPLSTQLVKAKSARELGSILGISHTRVNALVNEGRLTKNADGFDVDAARAELKRNLDPAQQKRAAVDGKRRTAAPKTEPKKTADKDPEPNQPEDRTGEESGNAYEQFNRARARRETVRADIDALEYRKLTSEVIETALVSSTWAAIAVKIRDAVMAIPTRTVNRMPDEWRRIVHKVVDEESRRVLQTLSDDIRNAATPS